MTEHQAAPHDSHNICADRFGIGDAGHHLVVRGPVLAPFESIRMTPGVDPVKLVLVQLGFQFLEPARIGIRREEARLERNPVNFQLLGPFQKVLHGHFLGRLLLVRVDFAEEAVVTVAIDADLHFVPPEKQWVV